MKEPVDESAVYLFCFLVGVLLTGGYVIISDAYARQSYEPMPGTTSTSPPTQKHVISQYDKFLCVDENENQIIVETNKCAPATECERLLGYKYGFSSIITLLGPVNTTRLECEIMRSADIMR